MNCAQDLSLPRDIPWRRLAFTSDMMDRDFDDPRLPKKWSSSVAAFYYVLPEEQTEEIHPGRRIVYVKVSASISGINLGSEIIDGLNPLDVGATEEEVNWLNEVLSQRKKNEDSSFPLSGLIAQAVTPVDQLGLELAMNAATTLQASGLEQAVVMLAHYYPCEGAILQVSVYPCKDEDADIWDFPYIQDFEPKKRELYETAEQSTERLSGSFSNVSTKKGTTNFKSTEETGGGGISVGPLSGSYTRTSVAGTEGYDITTTDRSRERREMESYTTVLSQMYQPVLGYHLGTNRALWAISPRPHTIDSEFNLISISPFSTYEKDGGVLIGRKLEGIQDVFMIISAPKESNGLGIQINLDTGHTHNYKTTREIETTVTKIEKEEATIIHWDSYMGGTHRHYHFTIPGKSTVVTEKVRVNVEDTKRELVVLRRTIQVCGSFKTLDDGRTILELERIPRKLFRSSSQLPFVVYESHGEEPPTVAKLSDLTKPERKRELVTRANNSLQEVIKTMLASSSNNVYRPRPLIESGTFKRILSSSLMHSDLPITEVPFINEDSGLQKRLRRHKIRTVSDLMRRNCSRNKVLKGLKEDVIRSAMKTGSEIMTYQAQVMEEASKRLE